MKQNGFALIEMLIVLVIIGLITSIASLEINSFMVKSDINNVANELVGDLRYMQQLSINGGTGPFCSILLITNKPNGYYILLDNNIQKRVNFPNSVIYINNIPSQFSFGMNGYPPQGMTIYIKSGKENRHVIIDSVGRVRIYNPNLR